MKTRSGILKWIVGILALLVPLIGLTVWRFLRILMSDDPAIWAKEIANFQKQDRNVPLPEGVILFVGSSSIRFWQTLEQDMAPLPVMNRGFGGAKIKQVTYYADQIVIPYHPKAVVLFAGTNDLGRFNTKTAQEVFEGYVEFVNAIHKTLPQTPIYYIAITPTPSRWKIWLITHEANQLIKSYTETDNLLHFIDMTDKILGSDGRPRRDLFKWDRLHPNAKGYAIWTASIKPILEADLFRSQTVVQE